MTCNLFSDLFSNTLCAAVFVTPIPYFCEYLLLVIPQLLVVFGTTASAVDIHVCDSVYLCNLITVYPLSFLQSVNHYVQVVITSFASGICSFFASSFFLKAYFLWLQKPLQPHFKEGFDQQNWDDFPCHRQHISHLFLPEIQCAYARLNSEMSLFVCCESKLSLINTQFFQAGQAFSLNLNWALV